MNCRNPDTHHMHCCWWDLQRENFWSWECTKAVPDPWASPSSWNSQTQWTPDGSMRVIHGCYFVSSWMKMFERITNRWWQMYSSISGKEIRANFSVLVLPYWWLQFPDICPHSFFSLSLRISELVSEIFTSVCRCIWSSSRETGRSAELSDSLSLESVTSILNRYSI